MKNNLSVIAIVIVVAGAAFYGGIRFAEGKSLQTNMLQGNGQKSANSLQRQGMFGQDNATGLSRRNGGNPQGGNMINGDIIESDANSITIKLPNGGSQIVFYSATTKISKSVDTTASDLIDGKSVMITGSKNSDGSLTAANIQIRPAMPPRDRDGNNQTGQPTNPKN